ncbi:MAG: bifunctional demethylmenaquinone methyltransferase/2-methoxy-6-polyprenyl-1,4-benzoquinol methylase UbiE [Acidobacteriaceae bacterium]|jgi:demethylmenaquinone methyltransferase/2-methoxy-6-polyprenyl-1,4-benzoquinol methylase
MTPPETLRQPDLSPGARPTGTSTQAAAAQNIQQMFDAIAPTYDRANHILSLSLDRTWWTRAARTLRPILARPEAVILDLCCGTGDMTLALHAHRPTPSPTTPNSQLTTVSPILALDFSHNMLALALPKFAGKNILPIEADALHLPLASNSIDLVTTAFGFRNLSNYPAGLTELHRVLRPGGQIAILEFNQPTGPIGAFYNLYFRHILPRVGGLISHSPREYAYLPGSVARFPTPPRMIELIASAGFTSPTWTPYTFGVAGLYRATKP